jgi:hypothetical protein
MIMATAIPRIAGIDGKHYPIFRLSDAEREILLETIHQLRHDQSLSITSIQQWLADRSAPVSRGSIQKYLRQRCDQCPPQGITRLFRGPRVDHE